jgi:hypothetical protein
MSSSTTKPEGLVIPAASMDGGTGPMHDSILRPAAKDLCEHKFKVQPQVPEKRPAGSIAGKLSKDRIFRMGSSPQAGGIWVDQQA